MNNIYFKTSDIGLCAALISSGYQVEGLEKIKDNRTTFSIKRDSYLDSNISKYFNHQLEVDALTFFNSMKELKSRIYHT